MGLYAEPSGSKYRWIKDHGTPLSGGFAAVPADRSAVLFMDCETYQALAYAFNEQEFRRLDSGRPDGQWFTVAKSDLRAVIPGGERMKELK